MSALIANYDAALFDLDGVVYLGPVAVDGVPAALEQIREAGSKVGFVTNNAARTPAVVAEHLTELGIRATAEDVVNSTQATLRMLAADLPAGARVFAVGTDALKSQLEGAGFIAVGPAEDPAAVIQGYNPQVEWATLEAAAHAVQRGVPWYATNPDLTRPTDQGIVPGLGAQVAVVRVCVDVDPKIAGKPYRPLLDETVRRMAANRPIFVGDRVDTDILGANNVGMDSLFVFTGAHGKYDLAEASPQLRPTYIGYSAAALLEPAREVQLSTGQLIRCGGQEVAFGNSLAQLLTAPKTQVEQLDALWAALQVKWRYEVDVAAILQQLDLLR